MDKRKSFLSGMKDGIPVGIGYLTVAFSLGISAKVAGLNAFEGFFASLITIASAGEYAAFNVIKECAPFITMAIVILVTNCRYLLMSCVMSQRTKENEKWYHRLGMGAFITDEIFGLAIAREGFLNPYYIYGIAAVSVLPWSLGTSLGILIGNVLPIFLVKALSISLYGMFLAIIIPPAKKDKKLLGIIVFCFAASYFASYIPISESIRTVILTVVISILAALLFPVKDKEGENG